MQHNLSGFFRKRLAYLDKRKKKEEEKKKKTFKPQIRTLGL